MAGPSRVVETLWQRSARGIECIPSPVTKLVPMTRATTKSRAAVAPLRRITSRPSSAHAQKQTAAGCVTTESTENARELPRTFTMSGQPAPCHERSCVSLILGETQSVRVPEGRRERRGLVHVMRKRWIDNPPRQQRMGWRRREFPSNRFVCFDRSASAFAKCPRFRSMTVAFSIKHEAALEK